MPEWVGLSSQPPDFGNALARIAQIKALERQGAASQQQIDAQNRLTTLAANPDFFRRYIANDPNALAEAAGTGLPGFNMAVPRADLARQQNEFNALFGGNAPPAATPAAAPASPPNPNATPASMPPLGLRNNNPLNLRFAGQDGAEPGEGGFARFPSIEAGLSAAQRQLALYGQRGVNTLRGAISRWAPPSENDTDGYVTRVAQATGIDPDAPINLADPAVTQRIIPAMARVELGQALPAAGEGGPASAAAPRQPLATGFPGAPTMAQYAQATRLATTNPIAAAWVKAWEPFMLRQNAEPPETWAPMTPEQRTQYGVPPNVPAAISSRGQPRLPGTPQTNVSIDQRGETSFANAYNKDLAEQASALAATPRRSAQTIARLDRAEALLDRFTTGAGANARLSVGALAQQLGVPDSVMSNLGLDRNAVAAGESIRGLTNQLLIGMIGSGGFPAQNFSNADRESLERALVSVANTPGGNRLIIATLRNAARVDQQVGQEWLRYSQRNGATADSYQRFLTERVPEITQGLDPYAGIFEAVQSANLEAPPAGGAAVPGPGGQGTATPPPAAPRVGEVRDGYRFRGGNPADQAAWEAVR